MMLRKTKLLTILYVTASISVFTFYGDSYNLNLNNTEKSKKYATAAVIQNLNLKTQQMRPAVTTLPAELSVPADQPEAAPVSSLTVLSAAPAAAPDPAPAPVQATPEAASPAEITVVRKGDENYKVNELQEKLNKFNYNLVVDGHFGNKTLEAVRSFQYSVHIKCDGIAGPATFSKLNSTAPSDFKIPDLPKPAAAPSKNNENAAGSGYPLKTNSMSGIMDIDIPKINVHAGILRGVGDELPQLAVGPSLLDSSPLPDELFANVVIGAHRSTYGAWFRYIDRLSVGDNIYLDYNGIRYTYSVIRNYVTVPSDPSITGQYGYSCLTLYACHPVGSAAQRYIVQAKYVSEEAVK
jgi:LPXTG-site transpeptidase (sortase) family protein